MRTPVLVAIVAAVFAVPCAATPAAHAQLPLDDIPLVAPDAEWGDDGTGWEDDGSWGDEGREDEPEWKPEPEPQMPETRMKVVKGTQAKIRPDGTAAVPRSVPKRVRDMIRAANRIVGKPYKWGGGHARLEDRGYDCSGAVSYALIKVDLLRAPKVSGRLARTFSSGEGRHVTVYANKGHVYMEVAGLRLDTSTVGHRDGRKGVAWRPVIGKRKGFEIRHPKGL